VFILFNQRLKISEFYIYYYILLYIIMANTNIQFYTDTRRVFETSSGEAKTSIGSANGTVQGLEIEYNLLTTPEAFKISPSGINYTKGITGATGAINYTTPLDRIAQVGSLLRSVDVPPDARTLQVDKRILLNDGVSTGSIGISGVNTQVTSSGNLILDPVTSIVDLLGNTLDMGGGDIIDCPLIQSVNNNNIIVEGRGTGDVILKTGSTNRLTISETGVMTFEGGMGYNNATDTLTATKFAGTVKRVSLANNNTIGTFYPVFATGADSQSLFVDSETGPFSIDPSNGIIRLSNKMKIDSGRVGFGNDAGLTGQGTNTVAIGNTAGRLNQGDNCVAIGNGAGNNGQKSGSVGISSTSGVSNQGQNCVALGPASGSTSQGGASVAIGQNAATTSQGSNAVAIGIQAAQINQGIGAVTIGAQAGQGGSGLGQGDQAIALGDDAGQFVQGASAVAIGAQAGENNQGATAVAIGQQAGQGTDSVGQGDSAVAIGFQAGAFVQGTLAVAIGPTAGQNNQGASAVAIGDQAGQGVTGSGQGDQAIAIGFQAGEFVQGTLAVAIGNTAGQNNQGASAVAIGDQAGQGTAGSGQGDQAIAIGLQAGEFVQGTLSVAIGNTAGQNNQGANSIAIGDQAGQGTVNPQGSNAIAIGVKAGQRAQYNNTVAIGFQAGNPAQTLRNVAIGSLTGGGTDAICIGNEAGRGTANPQGVYSIAIGAFTGQSSQRLNSIGINASGIALNPNVSGLFIRPIRDGATGSSFNPSLPLPANVLYYSTTDFEVLRTI
jgi:hypothetical protein